MPKALCCSKVVDQVEKIDLIYYMILVLLMLQVLGAVLRTYNGWYREGSKLYAFIERQLGKGDFQSALASTERHLKRLPHDGRLLYYKAKALYKLGRNNEALAAFEELKKLEPAWTRDADNYIQTIQSAT